MLDKAFLKRDLSGIPSRYRRNREQLLEWIAFHRLQGFQHFYIFSNDETPDELIEILRPNIEARVVDVIDWGWDPDSNVIVWSHQVQLSSSSSARAPDISCRAKMS